VRAKVTEEVTGAIADSINYTIDELRRLVTGITSAATEVTAATQQAQAVTGQLLQAAQKQSVEIQGTGRAVAQMTQAMTEVSKNAGDSAKVAETSLHAAEKGAQGRCRTRSADMNDIREQIQETSKRIKRLGESSQEIGEIVQLISDITEQTNVLALNAPSRRPPPARRDAASRSVAEEVQRLAERSAEATEAHQRDREIDSAGQRRTRSRPWSAARRAWCREPRRRTRPIRPLREIGQVSNRLAELIGAISNATQQQAESATKVAANMKAILAITQLTTEGTKQTCRLGGEADHARRRV